MNNKFTHFTERINWQAISSDRGRTVITSIALGLIGFLIISQQAANAHQLKLNSQVLSGQSQILSAIKHSTDTLTNDNHADHDKIVGYIKCLVDLSSKTAKGEPVTQADLDACLTGTRLAPETQSTTTTSPTPQATSQSPAASAGENKNPSQKSNQTSSAKTGQGTRSMVCKLTFNLLGCK